MGIVLSNGCYDCLHLGHVLQLQEAKKLGTFHIVALTVDDQVKKGPGRPCFPYEQRELMLRALSCIDDVVPSANIMEVIKALKPAIFVKGADWRGKLDKEIALVQSLGGQVAIIKTTPQYSSTDILTGRLLHELRAKHHYNKRYNRYGRAA